MISLTGRYKAIELEALASGWRVGLGTDLKLDRNVVLAVLSQSSIDKQMLDAWLQCRSTLSHPYVAQLLDIALTDQDVICVFESAKMIQFGLPNLSSASLLTVFIQIVEGMETLFRSGISSNFHIGELLYDGKKPSLLGLLPRGISEDITEKEIVQNLALYLGHALEWVVVSGHAISHEPIAPVWQTGLERLLRHSTTLQGFGDLQALLSVMVSQDDMVFSNTSSEEDETSRMQRSNMLNLRSLPDREMEDTATYELDEIESLRPRMVGRLTFFSIGILVLVIAILFGGQWLLHAQKSPQTIATPVTPPALPAKAKGSTSNISHKVGSTQNVTSHNPTDHFTSVIPNVVSKNLATAVMLLQKAGISETDLVVKSITGQGVSGDVASILPSAGSSYQKGQSVILQVDLTSGQEIIPSIVGLPLKTVSAVLLENHIHYSYTMISSKGNAIGNVVNQSPSAYQIVPTNAKLIFQVAASY
nr:PASTA domain-containing protein [Bacilli bacterium]